jgi:macrolide transport system ATP-binding/permease protein
MRWWRELAFIVDRLIHRRRAERELDEEISVHRELEIEQNIASGMSPEEARNAANRSFGSVALSKELSRNAWGLRWLETLWQDLRYGLRMLSKSPGFCAVAVVSLGLGIGVNAAVFSLVNAAFLKTLPVDNPEGLVYVIQNRGSAPASYLNYRDYCELNRSFSRLAAYSSGRPIILTEQGQVQFVNTEVVSGNYFSVLGIQPVMGRAFIEGEDDRLGAEPTVMISHAFWRRRFNSDPELIGKQISLKDNKVTVIGIVPERFSSIMPPMPANIWVTITTFARIENDTSRINRGMNWLSMIGRLKPGVSIEQAQAEMEILVNNVRQANRTDTNSPHKLVKVTLSPVDQLNPAKGKDAPSFILILGAAFLVLLIACINIASLTLARASSRQKEIAIRLALGAGRPRLVVQLLAENIVLALFCGAAGLILSYWVEDLSRSFVPARFANVIPALNIDLNVAAYTIGLSLVTGILFGLVPALRVSKPHLTQVLSGNIGLGREGRRGWNLRNLLIIFQVAVSFVMLIAAGLFVRAWEREKATGATLNTGNILITSGDFGNKTNLDQLFYRDLGSRIAAIPGVQSASFSHNYPIDHDFTNSYREGEDNSQSVSQNMVSHGYLQTMKIPVVHGRDFTKRDDASSPNVIIVNETAARILWPGQEPLGKLLRIGGPDEPSREVVGVVKDVRYNPYGNDIRPQVFVPLEQRFRPNLTLIVRASSDNPKLLSEPIRREIKAMNNDAPLFLDFQTHDELVSLFLLPMRAGSILLSVFGAVVLLVSTIGLYGLTAYTVIIRTREIGIRAALGAQRKDIIRLMVKEAAIISFVGIAVGLAIALAVTRLLSSLLYGISSTDPLTYAAVSVFFALVVVSAFYIPARKATKINPLDALRYE